MASNPFLDPVVPENEILRPPSQPPSPAERRGSSELHAPQQSVNPQAASSSQKDDQVYTVQSNFTDARHNIIWFRHEATFSDLQPANRTATELAQGQWDSDEAPDDQWEWYGDNGEVRIFRVSTVHDQHLSCFVTMCEIDHKRENDEQRDDRDVRFPKFLKLILLLQTVFICFLAGSLLLAFTNNRSVSSWHPSLESWKGFNSTAGKQAEDKIGEPPFSKNTSIADTNGFKDSNGTLLQLAPKYLKAILNPEDTLFDRLSCPALKNTRYQYLQSTTSAKVKANGPKQWKYFFALDLTQCAHILPRLISSIVEVIHFLGPRNCALSIVEGNSIDGTYEILLSLRQELEKAGITYYFSASDINPKVGRRIVALAKLRNLALQPLFDNVLKAASSDTTILFLNDVSICMEDILELIHQRRHQSADMVCAMDWVYLASNPTFFDVWVARGMNGDTFFDIPPSGSWDSAWNIFWNNNEARTSLENRQPFQVYSCWNGATAMGAKPFLESGIRFRAEHPGECPQGEPKSLCKDFWLNGYGKIAVVPSVSLDYSDEGATKVKAEKGYVSDWVSHGTKEKTIKWVKDPPEKVKCMPDYTNQTWQEWDAPKGVKSVKRDSLTPVELDHSPQP
ncbi:MAG: hypothetical protein Q9216_000850 [Gyalolechia sp. 2 TL-2023]